MKCGSLISKNQGMTYVLLLFVIVFIVFLNVSSKDCVPCDLDIARVLRHVPEKTLLVKSNTKPSFFIALVDPQMDTIVSKTINETGLWDVHVLKKMAELAEQTCNKKKHVVMDVGGNVGVFTQALLAWGCEVYTFEMASPLAARIEFAAAMNGNLRKLHLHQVALSDTKKKVKITPLNVGNMGATSIVSDKSNGETLTVDSQRLDDLNFPEDILLMKLDVEGHELKVLQGGLSLLRGGKIKNILMEFSPKTMGVNQAVQLLELVNVAGFKSICEMDHQYPTQLKEQVRFHDISMDLANWALEFSQKIASGGDSRKLGFVDLWISWNKVTCK
jgi:FkbM family methyltransferase